MSNTFTCPNGHVYDLVDGGVPLTQILEREREIQDALAANPTQELRAELEYISNWIGRATPVSQGVLDWAIGQVNLAHAGDALAQSRVMFVERVAG